MANRYNRELEFWLGVNTDDRNAYYCAIYDNKSYTVITHWGAVPKALRSKHKAGMWVPTGGTAKAAVGGRNHWANIIDEKSARGYQEVISTKAHMDEDDISDARSYVTAAHDYFTRHTGLLKPNAHSAPTAIPDDEPAPEKEPPAPSMSDNGARKRMFNTMATRFGAATGSLIQLEQDLLDLAGASHFAEVSELVSNHRDIRRWIQEMQSRMEAIESYAETYADIARIRLDRGQFDDPHEEEIA